METIKKNYLKTISDGLNSFDGNYPSVEIDTSQLKKWYKKGNCDTKGDHTMFGKMYYIMKSKKFECLRVQCSTNYGWYTNFTNEGYQDDGTYRKCQSWIMDELHSSFLPLFIPTKNNKDKVGPFQDRWTINPSCTSSLHLDMYRFIGALMAKAFRSGHVMDFKFTPVFWKKFICEPLTLEDVESIDQKLYNSLVQLRDNKEEEKESSPTNLQKLNFTVELSDGTKVPLITNGEDEYVSQDNSEKYIDLAMNKRFQESKLQLEAIKSGFDVVFPSEVARVLVWEDVEQKIRGDQFNIEKLKEITDYSGLSEGDEHASKFWKILKHFSPEEQTRYLRCVSGRARLPPEPRLRELRHQLYLREEDYFSNHDENDVEINPDRFRIQLNRFSSESIMKKKIMKAIIHSERYYHWGKSEALNDMGNNLQSIEEESSIDESIDEDDISIDDSGENEGESDESSSGEDDSEISDDYYDEGHSGRGRGSRSRGRASRDRGSRGSRRPRGRGYRGGRGSRGYVSSRGSRGNRVRASPQRAYGDSSDSDSY